MAKDKLVLEHEPRLDGHRVGWRARLFHSAQNAAGLRLPANSGQHRIKSAGDKQGVGRDVRTGGRERRAGRNLNPNLFAPYSPRTDSAPAFFVRIPMMLVTGTLTRLRGRRPNDRRVTRPVLLLTPVGG